jgi:predicted esterase
MGGSDREVRAEPESRHVSVRATSARGAWGIAHAPASLERPRPAIVYLHGMWASPEDSCPYFERAARPRGFLVCPRGNAPLGGGFMWRGSYETIAPRLAEALDAAEALAPGSLDRTHDGTLMGFSSGAAFAVKIALAEPGRWSGLVLMAMDLHLDVPRLRAAGVRRVLFAAADDDGSRPGMQREAARVDAAGIAARFVSLGRVGHHFAVDMEEKMDAAVAWARGE